MDQNTTAKPSLWGMIWRPGEQFERMKARPVFWGALIIVTVLMTIATVLTTMAIPDEHYELGPEAGIELAEEELALAKIFGLVFAGFGGFIGTPIGILISAAIMLLIATLAQTGATFRQMLSLNSYIYVIGVIGALINAIVHLAVGGDPTVTVTGLNSVVREEGVAGSLLNGIEIFSIWTTILTAIGLHKVAGLSKGLSWTVAIAFFVFGLAVSLITALFGEVFSGMAGV